MKSESNHDLSEPTDPSPIVDFDAPPADPLPLLQQWLADARTLDLPNPNAMTLATADENGRPSARIVLLKSFDEHGAVFFTNRTSRKGRELASNPRAALLLHWDKLDRQVRIEGPVTPTDDAESDAYFASRARESQIGAWASEQSQRLANRAELEQRVREVQERFGDGEIPRPTHWGGYRVALQRIELWQGRPARLHDRIVYTRTPDRAWTIERLAP